MRIAIINRTPSPTTPHKQEILPHQPLLTFSLAMMLAVNLTATIAVDEWIHQFKSLQEIDSEVSKVETSSS